MNNAGTPAPGQPATGHRHSGQPGSGSGHCHSAGSGQLQGASRHCNSESSGQLSGSGSGQPKGTSGHRHSASGHCQSPCMVRLCGFGGFEVKPHRIVELYGLSQKSRPKPQSRIPSVSYVTTALALKTALALPCVARSQPDSSAYRFAQSPCAAPAARAQKRALSQLPHPIACMPGAVRQP